MIQRNLFYFCECKRRLCRISRITFYVKIAFHSWLVQSTSWTGGGISILCYTDSHYVQKANEPIEQGERCAYKDTPLRQYSCHKTGHMNFSSHREMRRGRRELVSFFLSKKVENSCFRAEKCNNIDVKYIRRNIAITIFTLYGPSQLWLHQYFWKNAFLVAFLTHLLAAGGDGQTCYTWYRWLLRNQWCQGTRKMET